MTQKIATNSEIVSTITKAMLESSSHVLFNVKREISYSKSVSVTKLSQCIRDMKKATQEFQTGIDTDVKNLKKIHEAIKKTDQEWGFN